MSLARRLRQTAPPERPGRDAVRNELRREIHLQLINELGPVLWNDQLPEAKLWDHVQDELKVLLERRRSTLPAFDRDELIRDVLNDIIGYGPIDRYIHDPTVSEVMVNGPRDVFVEREGRIHPVETTFIDEAHLRRIIDKIVGQVGRRVDEATPMVDARLPDGSRVNVVTPPLSVGGPFLTIRKFAAEPLLIEDLVRLGTLTEAAAAFLQACVRGRLNVVVSGGTGTGKTTLLNVLSSWFAESERIITIEDAKELQLRQRHVLPMEARPPNIEGRGGVTIRDLVRNALRMRPDRIVVGEARGGEALDMLQAMNTGHDGSLTSVHSNTPHDAISRIETMALMAGLDLPVRAIRAQIASALDLIVHTVRLNEGTRRITNISEVVRAAADEIEIRDVFAAGPAEGRVGALVATGIVPAVVAKLSAHGVEVDPAMFVAPARTETRRSR